MKKIVLEFVRRGLLACGFGPMILAVVYLILHARAEIDVLSVQQASLGIFSLSALAFVAGGMNVIYHIEQLPLMLAVLIHGGVLYVSYLAAYLINGWMKWGTAPILVFSIIFVLGYLAIWAIIYSVTRKNTEKVNELLKKKQRAAEE